MANVWFCSKFIQRKWLIVSLQVGGGGGGYVNLKRKNFLFTIIEVALTNFIKHLGGIFVRGEGGGGCY